LPYVVIKHRLQLLPRSPDISFTGGMTTTSPRVTTLIHYRYPLLTYSRPHGYTLADIYQDAIRQLQGLKDAGSLSAADYETLTETKEPKDILDTLQYAIEKNATSHADVKRRAQKVVEPLLLRLERFGSAIDVLAQSAPQAVGLNLVGLIWGSVRFLLVVSC
jgi:hypothetical protein